MSKQENTHYILLSFIQHKMGRIAISMVIISFPYELESIMFITNCILRVFSVRYNNFMLKKTYRQSFFSGFGLFFNGISTLAGRTSM